MKKIYILLFIMFLITGCESRDLVDLRIEIILDHPIKSNLNEESNLMQMLDPFEGKDLILNFVPLFKKIDQNPVLIDSIKIESNWITAGQEWLGGGKRNPRYFIKKRKEQIRKAEISTAFTKLGSQGLVDDFYKKNPGNYVFYSTDTALINQVKVASLSNVVFFSSIDSLKLFLFNQFKKSTISDQAVRIIFNPRFKIKNDSTVLTTILESGSGSTLAILDDTIPRPPHSVNGIAKTTMTLSQKEVCDERVVECLKMENNETKVVYFFSEIFRFVKNTDCNSAEYRSLLDQIRTYLEVNNPSFKSMADNRYFSLTCSHKTDFRNELVRFNIPFSASEFNKIFKGCPNS